MRIGISIATHEGQSIWANGKGQNVVFLAQVFLRLPFVTSVVLIDVGNQKRLPTQVDALEMNLRVLSTQEATDAVDIVIELGGALNVRWLDLMRARGKKVVFYCCEQPFVGLAETSVFEKPGHSSRPDRCDEVWLLPKDSALIPMMRILHRCEVHIAPYIWDSRFIESRAREVAQHGFNYGYHVRRADLNGRRSALRVAIFEPNISVVKTSVVPMLICDEVERVEPGAIQAMHVLNTLHMKDHSTMLHLANSLNLIRAHKATFHGRHDIVGFMAQHADAVVSHQWCNDQNYSYLDALYGDYPLIHNSSWLSDAGYYYPHFDSVLGAAKLQHAAATHDAGLVDYRARSRHVFDAVDPLASHNLEGYAARLKHLCRDTAYLAEGRRS